MERLHESWRGEVEGGGGGEDEEGSREGGGVFHESWSRSMSGVSLRYSTAPGDAVARLVHLRNEKMQRAGVLKLEDFYMFSAEADADCHSSTVRLRIRAQVPKVECFEDGF